MATTPIKPSLSSSSARKLPIKRKSSSSNALTTINPPSDHAPVAAVAFHHHDPDDVNDDFDDDDDEEDEEEDQENEDEEADDLKPARPPPSTSQQPFKFHRIWSESDEIRFLQGLLGCYSQNMVFPMDLHLFYDRFSESMPQPFTRSQLSEKLRRLRKKYRLMSARVARGHDLPPHDRDLLHLCTRLWHPEHAASSPFSGASSPSPASVPSRNKRSRRRADPPSLPEKQSPLVDVKVVNASGQDKEQCPLPKMAKIVKQEERSECNMVAKVVLDVYDSSLNDLRMTLVRHGLLCLDGRPSETAGGDLERRWKEQRAAEVDALARRLRLILEHALQV